MDGLAVTRLILVTSGIRRVIVCQVYAPKGSGGMSPREKPCVTAFVRGYLFASYML